MPAVALMLVAALALAPSAVHAQMVPDARAPIEAQQVAVNGTAVHAGRVSTVVEAPFDAVAAVALDFAHYHEFLPQVRQSRVVRRRRAQSDVYIQIPLLQNLGMLWALVRFDAVRSPGSLIIAGTEQQGNVSRFEFRIELSAMPGAHRTRAVVQLLAVPALPLPASMVSGQQSRWAGRGLAALRDRAERSAGHGMHPTGGGPRP